MLELSLYLSQLLPHSAVPLVTLSIVEFIGGWAEIKALSERRRQLHGKLPLWNWTRTPSKSCDNFM